MNIFTKQLRPLDMLGLVSFALWMLLHSHTAAAGHRSILISGRSGSSSRSSSSRSSSSGKLQRRMEIQMQTSDNNLYHLQAAEEAAGRTLSLDHSLQPSKISKPMGTEISTHANAKPGEKPKDSADMVDSLTVESQDVGVLPRVSKRMDLQYSTSSVDFESVHNDLVDSETSHPQNHGVTKRMDLDLTASDSLQTMQMSSDKRMQPLHEGLCMYTITTETGKKWAAGTDSTISLALYNGDEDRAYFAVLDNGKNNFEKGHIDTFSDLAPCVENICKMILSTDNSGLFADWYVETLGFSVTTPMTGHQEKTWELHQWLPSDDASASLFIMKDDCSYVSAPTPPVAP